MNLLYYHRKTTDVGCQGKVAVTSKGQITLPKQVRDALGLVPGSQIEFEIERDKVNLRKRVSPER
ncbi:MAG TPA: AbrB/MazE/SpoVT family DNA-binding domain-containing protein [Dehalococcoidia bacterium]|nr:AbrB/MazE/SpoVT family DNA-binding domain-containing protein [Dehalococcoidia bacterium]